jgi:DNA-binding NtrC family response regulator
VKGAFTGASESSNGLFTQAEGGTLFLDEVGELTPLAQVSLLRALETRRITPVGATREIPVNVRVLAATHRDLAALVTRGAFREDLLYRLNTVTLHVPPLRERGDEILVLADTLLRSIAQAWATQPSELTDAAKDTLSQYAFPGNVRELRNILEHAMVSADCDTIDVSHLPERVRGVAKLGEAFDGTRADGLSFRERVEQYEGAMILQALAIERGNQTSAAARLRIPRRTLVHKLRTYSLLGKAGF